jgi:hypothetical protein
MRDAKRRVKGLRREDGTLISGWSLSWSFAPSMKKVLPVRRMPAPRPSGKLLAVHRILKSRQGGLPPLRWDRGPATACAQGLHLARLPLIDPPRGQRLGQSQTPGRGLQQDGSAIRTAKLHHHGLREEIGEQKTLCCGIPGQVKASLSASKTGLTTSLWRRRLFLSPKTRIIRVRPDSNRCVEEFTVPPLE